MTWTRRRLAEIRNRPLEPLAEALGYRRDPTDRKRWKRPGSAISIDGPRFFDHVAQSGGGGAIDLVLHAKGCSFRDAVLFLDGPPDFEPPARHDPNWPEVRRWLCTRRTLDPGLVDRCRGQGLLSADGRANAVFACRDRDGGRTGAELVGTRPGRPFKGMARGSRKSAGGFWIARRTDPKTALLVEGAVDALSAWTLDEDARLDIIISTVGVTGRMPEWTDGFRLGTVLCGYDADDAGDRAAGMLEARNPSVRRMRPDGGKDWNEVLQGRVKARS